MNRFLLLCLVALLAGCSASADDATNTNSAMMMTALRMAGVQTVTPLPTDGCSVSAIPPERVVELVNAFPEQQRALLAQVLSASSVAWSVQMYSGPLGAGLCFPANDSLVLMPQSWVSGQAAISN